MQRSNASSQDKTVYLWWVPLTYTTDFQTIGSTWLADGQTSKKHELSIPADKNQWVIFNVDQMGVASVNGFLDLIILTRINCRLLSHQLRFEKLADDWPTVDD